MRESLVLGWDRTGMQSTEHQKVNKIQSIHNGKYVKNPVTLQWKNVKIGVNDILY